MHTVTAREQLKPYSAAQQFDLLVLLAGQSEVVTDWWCTNDIAAFLASVRGCDNAVPLVLMLPVGKPREYAAPERRLAEVEAFAVSVTASIAARELADAIRFIGAPTGGDQICSVITYLYEAAVAKRVVEPQMG